MKLKKYFLLLISCFVSLTIVAQEFYFTQNGVSVTDVPNPKNSGQAHFVTDMTHLLSQQTINQINMLSQELDEKNEVEYAVVLVDNYNGDTAFNFAFDLFTHWGIGKKGKDTGLLLFISKDTREWRFITGYGLEGILTDAYLKRIGEQYLVPNFKNGNYDAGILETSQIIRQILLAPDAQTELQRLFPAEPPIDYSPYIIWIGFFLLAYVWIHFVQKMTKGTIQVDKSSFFRSLAEGCGCSLVIYLILLFVIYMILEVFVDSLYLILISGSLALAFKYERSYQVIMQSYADEKEKNKAFKKFFTLSFIPMLFSPLAYITALQIIKRFLEAKARFAPPDDSNQWIRQNREWINSKTLSAYLDKGQRREETLGSVKYEIWTNTQTGEVVLKPWNLSKKYTQCPSCGYKTLQKNIRQTIVEPTYTSTGEGEKYDKCNLCYYRFSHGFYTIAKKVQSSSGSGGSFSSRGGGGGGSFGGGSSGGGGAGGRW